MKAAVAVVLCLAFLIVSCAPMATGPTLVPAPSPVQGKTPIPKGYFLTREALTPPEFRPRNLFTVAALSGTQFAAATADVLTATAKPTVTPSPTIPPQSRYCTSGDLEAAAGRAMGATQSLVFGVSFKNGSDSPCYMQTWPEVVLMDRQGNALAVDYYFGNGTSGPAAATQQARESISAKVGLWPGWTAHISLVWGNWCGEPIWPGVVVHLKLMGSDGTMDVPTEIAVGGRCLLPDRLSYVAMSKLHVMPPEE